MAEKEREMSWMGVNVTRDDEELAGLEGSEWHWRRTQEAMDDWGPYKTRLWLRRVAVCEWTRITYR